MRTIDAHELKEMMARDPRPTLINTLGAESFGKTRISEAINIPGNQPDFASQVEAKVGGRDKPVIVYCASASCNSSELAAEKLEGAGFTEVYDFEGGAEAWQQAGEQMAVGSK